MEICTSVLKGFHSKVTCHFHSHFIDPRKSYGHGEGREGQCHCGRGKKRTGILVKRILIATVREDMHVLVSFWTGELHDPLNGLGAQSSNAHCCPYYTE